MMKQLPTVAGDAERSTCPENQSSNFSIYLFAVAVVKYNSQVDGRKTLLSSGTGAMAFTTAIGRDSHLLAPLISGAGTATRERALSGFHNRAGACSRPAARAR